MNRYNRSDKVREPAAVPLVSKRLLDQVRERIRYLHYSLQTEKAYVYWVRFFVRWSGIHGGMRHPRELGSAEVEAFLTMLADERQVSPATHRQAGRFFAACSALPAPAAALVLIALQGNRAVGIKGFLIFQPFCSHGKQNHSRQTGHQRAHRGIFPA